MKKKKLHKSPNIKRENSKLKEKMWNVLLVQEKKEQEVPEDKKSEVEDSIPNGDTEEGKRNGVEETEGDQENIPPMETGEGNFVGVTWGKYTSYGD